MVKSLARGAITAAGKAISKRIAKEAVPVIGKEVAEQTFKSLDITAKQAYENLGKFDGFNTLADESKQGFAHHFDSLPSHEIKPESELVNGMFQKMGSPDPEIANIGAGQFNEIDHAFRTVNHTSHEAAKQTAKRAEISKKPPLP